MTPQARVRRFAIWLRRRQRWGSLRVAEHVQQRTGATLRHWHWMTGSHRRRPPRAVLARLEALTRELGWSGGVIAAADW
jgi:hypothetical protein